MDFKERLLDYKRAIDNDIAAYSVHARISTRKQFGEQAGEVSDAFLDLLESDGKRIRGALVMSAYEMLGGTNRTMILRAATALEMFHAYMLMVDDIQDRSPLRRGRESAHAHLAKLYPGNDSAHIGVSLALNAAVAGAHAAQTLLAGLEVSDELKIKAIGIINMTMITTAHGQTYDLINQLKTPTDEELTRVLLWKTTEYTFLNPLCTGMVLAGAGCKDTDAIRDYALAAGQAFQIRDDILGVTGTPGKDPLDDLREGKQTVLTVFALQHAQADEVRFLKEKMGYADATSADLTRFNEIILSSGAKEHAQALLERHIAAGVQSLDDAPESWATEQKQFLRDLIQSLSVS